MKIDLGYFCIPAALIFSAVLLTHTSEGVFGFIFAVLFFCIKFIGKNLKKSQIIYVTICLVLAFIISLHYLIIFQNTWGDNKYQFLVEPIWNGNPGFYIMDFKVLLIFIIAGILFSLFKMKDMHIALIAAIAMLISGFLNYIGFGLRSFQIRFFWPVYLAVFFGFGLYMLLKFAMKSWNLYYSVLFFFIFIVLLINFISIPIIPQYKKTTSQGIMDPYHWSILKWIEDKSEPNARVYFFYGDIYSQDAVLRNSKRLHHLINIEDFVNAIKDKKIKRIYISKLPGDAGGGLKIRQGLFKFKDLSREVPLEYYLGPQDICKFDYLVFDKVSRQQALAQYNLLIANELLRKEFIEKAFENEIAIILKNNKIGADCIEERSF